MASHPSPPCSDRRAMSATIAHRANSPVMPANPLRFGLIFLLLFALLEGAFEASRGSAFERVMVEDLFLLPTAAVIHGLTPQDPVELDGRVLVSRTAKLQVTRGCEGIELLLLLVSAIAAFPARMLQKTRGLLCGSLLAYLLGIARLVALDYTLRYAPGAWVSMHGLIMPLLPVIAIALYFLRWSRFDGERRQSDQKGTYVA